jgi:hypothetical protein
MKTNLITLAVALTVLAFFVVHVWSQRWAPMRITGAVIGLPSLALLVLARIQLGGSFSVGAQAQALLHPQYFDHQSPEKFRLIHE